MTITPTATAAKPIDTNKTSVNTDGLGNDIKEDSLSRVKDGERLFGRSRHIIDHGVGAGRIAGDRLCVIVVFRRRDGHARH